MDQNKKMILISLVTIGVLVVFGAVFMLKSKQSVAPVKKNSTLPQNGEIFPTVDSSVVVTIVRVGDGKRVQLKIGGIPTGTNTIDYEFSYDTKAGVPRGVIGTITPTDSTYQKEIVLGSCSTNICTYDEGVNTVKVSLKFNATSGEAQLFEKEFALE